MTLTFIDTGVLIAAVRAQAELARRALEILIDPQREFASSAFVRLEVLPKPLYFRRTTEVEFLNLFFSRVSRWADPLDDLVALAAREAAAYGLSALDALHVAAAMTVGAEEFVTTERPNAPIHRVRGVTTISIYPG